MKKYIGLIRLIGFTGLIGLALVASAQEANITFPVEELGGCNDEQACRAYCDLPKNISDCVRFAKKNGLIDEREAVEAEKFAAAMENGNTPGGCTSEASCHQYCENVNHIDECLTFAGENGMMDELEREEALKVAAALKRGAKLPAGCNSKQSCEEVCSNPDNMEACITFASDAGLMSGQELEESQKMLTAIRKGIKPPACGGKEACDAYCQEDAHFEECLNFAEAAGFIKSEEATMARKTGGKGPGGCKRDECKTFCENPDNQEVCTQFAIENGLMSAEDLSRMQEGKEKMKEGLERAPTEIQECLKASIGEEKLNRIREGTGFPTQEIGEKMRACFEQFAGQMGPPPGEGGERQGPPPGEGGRYQGPPPGGEYYGERRGPPEMIGPPVEGQYPMPPEGFKGSTYSPQEGQMPPNYQEQYRQFQEGNMPPEYQQQFQEQYRQQFEQQYQQQYQQYQGQEPHYQGPPPSGDGYTAPPPPDGGGIPQPPPSDGPTGSPQEIAPTSNRYSAVRDMASMLWVFLGLFQ